jgi:hypothetical protein
MIKRLERLKNTVNKYMADIQPDWLTICQSQWKSVVSRRPSVHPYFSFLFQTVALLCTKYEG